MRFRRFFVCLLVLGLILSMPATAFGEEKIAVKALILPKFEVEKMAGDFPGEAQYYYEHYLMDADSYEIPGGMPGGRLYVKDGVGLYLLGMGKISAALGTAAVLSDSRFDFSDAFILSTGCAGSSVGSTVMGDVFVITAAIDYDLGHHADSREMLDPTKPTWFRESDFDDIAVVRLNENLMDRVFSLVENEPLQTTERTRSYMASAYGNAPWAVRDPCVQRGTTVTADNYWKGVYDHANAVNMAETYSCKDAYATTEMEEVAVCRAVQSMGMLDRLIILRDSVNMDGFMHGATPESLWGDRETALDIATEESEESADIFVTAMENNFAAGRVIIDAILAGEL